MPTDIYVNTNNKISVRIPVSYVVAGTVYREFDSVADMLEKLNDDSYVEGLELAEDSEYIGDSYEVNMELITEYMIPEFTASHLSK